MSQGAQGKRALAYWIEIAPEALRVLQSFPDELREAVYERIDALEEHPRPRDGVPLPVGFVGHYRVRLTDVYLMGYDVDDTAMTVSIWVIGRREELRKLERRRGGRHGTG